MKNCTKKVNTFLLFALLCVALTVCAACGKLTLSRPTGLYIDSDTLTLKWNNVNGANRYVVSVDGTEQTVAYNEFMLEGLPVGSHTLKVCAIDKDGSYNRSEWSAELTFLREAENGLTYTLTSDKTSYVVTNLGTASGDIEIPSLYRGKKVTAIGESAFANKSAVTSVRIGDNVTRIGARAFYACTELTSVEIPDSVVTIEKNAFQSCRSLTTVELPSSVVSIGAEAFSYCSSLSDIIFSDGLLTIGTNAFYRCSALTEVTLPQSVFFIGEHAFDTCKALTKIDLGGAETVGNYAFADCAALTSVTMKSVTTLGGYAFSGCVALPSASLSTVTQIGDGAFFGCSALSDVNIGRRTERIGAYAFYGTKLWNDAADVVYVGTDSTGRWAVGCKSDSLMYVITGDDDTEGLYDYVLWADFTVGIADQAFMKYDGKNSSGLEKLSYVHLPNTLRTVGAYAFYASGLQSVQLGESTTEIGEYAFAYCKKMYQLTLYGGAQPDRYKLQTIGNYAFYQCENLGRLDSDSTVFPQTLQRIGTRAFNKTAFFPTEGNKVVVVGGWAVGASGTLSVVNVVSGVVGVADYAFFKETGITQVMLGDTVRYVGKGAFSKCTSLYSVDASQCADLQTLGDNAFYGCTALQEAALPASLRNVGKSAFSGCGYLTNLTFAAEGQTSRLENIGDYAFNGCASLTSLVLPQSVTTIGNSAFNACTSLAEVTLGSNLVSIGARAFKGCESLSILSFADGVTTIGDRAFYGCTSLAEVALPGSVETLGNYAFYGCSGLKSIDLGSGLQSIGTHAFYNCVSLSGIVLPESLTNVGAQAFRGCTGLASVVLRSGITVDKHVFYGCNDLTIYAEDDSLSEDWNALWNSSYRPTVWGATLSDDGSYVVSVVKSAQTLANVKGDKTVAAPWRKGYVFVGWSTTAGSSVAEYTAAEIVNVNDGTTLYAVWQQGETEEA